MKATWQRPQGVHSVYGQDLLSSVRSPFSDIVNYCGHLLRRQAGIEVKGDTGVVLPESISSAWSELAGMIRSHEHHQACAWLGFISVESSNSELPPPRCNDVEVSEFICHTRLLFS
jgi:hypothetical protein